MSRKNARGRGIPFTVLLFAFSILLFLFGTLSGSGGLFIFGFVVGLAALLRGMFLE